MLQGYIEWPGRAHPRPTPVFSSKSKKKHSKPLEAIVQILRENDSSLRIRLLHICQPRQTTPSSIAMHKLSISSLVSACMCLKTAKVTVSYAHLLS